LRPCNLLLLHLMVELQMVDRLKSSPEKVRLYHTENPTEGFQQILKLTDLVRIQRRDSIGLIRTFNPEEIEEL
jgi:hypothetical protein